MLSEASVVVRSEVPLTAVVSGETVMYMPDQGAYFGLGEVGSRVWELIERPVSVEDLCDALRIRFDVDAAACRRDVLPFLTELCEAGLARELS